MTRLFVAVDPPVPAVDDLQSVVDTLEVSRANAPGASTRVAPADRWHITLVFLGDVPSDRLEDAAAALDRACAAAVTGPISLRLAGGGTFGRGRFTILWARVTGDIPALRTLSTRLRRELRRTRLPFDDKPFRAHLTLARPGDRVRPEAISADVATLSGYVGPDWRVDGVHLVESDFVNTPKGVEPRYTRLHTVAV